MPRPKMTKNTSMQKKYSCSQGGKATCIVRVFDFCCSHCVLTKFPSNFHQVPTVFPNIFPIVLHFFPNSFPKVLLLKTYTFISNPNKEITTYLFWDYTKLNIVQCDG